jgi:RsiW-degrading membrane proteinase PrsW (M82 family)
MALLISFFFGFAPMLLFAWIIYLLDRFEKEPKILLGGVFLWGAVIAAGAALVINSSLAFSIFVLTNSEGAADLATGSLVAPIVEEIAKGLALVLVFAVARQEFDSILDGVIYASIVALGFAASENTLYIYRDGYQAGGYSGLLGMVFVRVVLVGWPHPFYPAFFGIGLAAARLSSIPVNRILAPTAGLMLAIFLHAAHNLLGRVLHGFTGFVAGTVYDWTGWFFMFLFILWAIHREQQWLVHHLSEEVSLGAITRRQYQTACSAWRQGLARLGALFSGHYRPTSRFYQVCAEIAHKKHQYATLGEENGNSLIIQSLRAELMRLSSQAME